MQIAVVGGGDTAMEEATFLTKFASKVYVIHRRDALRASKIMQSRAFKNDKIEFIYDTIVTEVHGDTEQGVEGLQLRNVHTQSTSTLKVQGLFLAIGHSPNTGFLQGSGLAMDNKGYVIVDPGTVNTNVKGVFACGDVQDTKYRQAITAAGTGCMAAMDAEKYLEELHDSQ